MDAPTDLNSPSSDSGASKAVRYAVAIIALIVIAAGGWYGFKYWQEMKAGTATETPDTQDTDEFTITRLDAKHFYTASEGVHTVAGEVVMPSPCDLLTWNAAILDDGPRAVLAFDVINNADDEDAAGCPQTPTPQRFKIGFAAPQDIEIQAMFKGKPIELNLVPAAEGENPADFELFIKG